VPSGETISYESRRVPIPSGIYFPTGTVVFNWLAQPRTTLSDVTGWSGGRVGRIMMNAPSGVTS
jgi:hypothetical protein